MKNNKRIASILTVLMLVCVSCFSVCAWADDYKYTVTVSGGVQGTASKSVQVEYGGSVTLSPEDVTINNDKYYLKGFHVSGQESPVVQAGDITDIKEDLDLVATYGIKQAMVKYTVKYVDENDDEIADEKTFYGNVGDKPVMAFTRIEGYTPKVYALTKSLTDNEDDNVFIFKYTSQEEEPENDSDDDDDDENNDDDDDDEADGTNGTNGTRTGNGNAPGNGVNIFRGNDGNNTDNGADDDTDGYDDGDDGIVDLDDQAAPTTDGSGSDEDADKEAGKNAIAGGVIAGGIAAAAVILAILIALIKRRK